MKHKSMWFFWRQQKSKQLAKASKKENDMECIGKVECRSNGHVVVEDNDGNEFNVFEHVGKSLYVGDYDALLKELHELRKEKARKQYLIDLFLRGTSIGKVSDKQIDAAIAKQKGE